MSIWQREISIPGIAQIYQNSIVSHLGIEFIEIGSNFLTARMPVDQRTKQPYGILHGGSSCVLAETIASIAAYYCVDDRHFKCVGIEINTSHIRSVSEGFVTGTAKPLHLGKSTQLWEIPITNDEDKLISMTRLRIAILDK